MKRKLTMGMVAAVIAAVVFGGCNLTGGDGLQEPEKTFPAWESTKTILDMSGTSAQSLGSFSPLAESTNDEEEEISSYSSDTDRMFFRSSDIEFWSVDSVEGIAEMASAGLPDAQDAESGSNVSKTIAMPDETETFVFVPGKTFRFSSDGVPTFENATYNMIRVDVGGGAFTFVVDGQEVQPKTSQGGSTGGFNSVMLVDKSFLSAPLLVPGHELELIRAGDDSSLEIPEADRRTIELFAEHGWTSDDNPDGDIDLSGALFIPLEPATVADGDNVTVEFSWDMAESLYQQNGEWYMADRVQGTCYDFSVKLVTN